MVLQDPHEVLAEGVVLQIRCQEDQASAEAQTLTRVYWVDYMTPKVTSSLAYNSRRNLSNYHQPATRLNTLPSSKESLVEWRMRDERDKKLQTIQIT